MVAWGVGGGTDDGSVRVRWALWQGRSFFRESIMLTSSSSFIKVIYHNNGPEHLVVKQRFRPTEPVSPAIAPHTPVPDHIPRSLHAPPLILPLGAPAFIVPAAQAANNLQLLLPGRLRAALEEAARVAHGKAEFERLLAHEVADGVEAEHARGEGERAARGEQVGRDGHLGGVGGGVGLDEVAGGDEGEGALHGAEDADVDEVERQRADEEEEVEDGPDWREGRSLAACRRCGRVKGKVLTQDEDADGIVVFGAGGATVGGGDAERGRDDEAETEVEEAEGGEDGVGVGVT